MTPYDVILAYEGWVEAEEYRQKQENLRTREVAYQVYLNRNLKKGHKHMSITKFWPIEDKDKIYPTKDERMQKYSKLNAN